MAPGKRKLEIKTTGFKMETQEVTLASGERKPIGIRLEPVAVASDKPTPPPDHPIGSCLSSDSKPCGATRLLPKR